MKLADLNKFVVIVQSGGLTQAAFRLGVTQPALSRTLRELELRMQAQLLRRNGRGVELTPAGEAFYAFADRTLLEFEATEKRVLDAADNLPKRLTLAIPLRLARVLLPELHQEFAARMAETTLNVFEESSDRCDELLADQRLDAALVYASAAAPRPETTPLFSEALYAIGAAELLAPADHPISLAELAGRPLLAPSRGSFRALIDGSFARARMKPVIARELETADAVLAFAAEREGVAILPYSNVYQECARGDVVARPIVQPELTRVLTFAAARSLSSGAVRLASAAMRAAVGRMARLGRWRRCATRASLRRATSWCELDDRAQ